MEDNTAGRGAAPGGPGHADGPPAPEQSPLAADPPSAARASLAAQSVPAAESLMADELPDGLVVADDAGRVIIFNQAAARLTSVAAEEAVGKFVSDVLPFRDDDGRDWWVCVDPYHGLATRTRHPERSLYLSDGTELLDVSRLESGRMEVHRELVDVPERTRRLIAGRVAAGEPEDRYRLEVASDLPDTWLDADKVDQILGNLVENAVRHGAGIVTIVVERARIGGDQAVAISVRDQGEGIPPEMAHRVFRQFWRGKRRGGTGLGLYIVKGLVEALGGDITVGRAPGGGAEFRFTVPAGAPVA